VKGSLLKLRGYARAGASCPTCGGETMSAPSPAVLRPVLSLLHLRFRWCRACLRQWLAPR